MAASARFRLTRATENPPNPTTWQRERKSEMSDSFKVGDVVILKSGGPKMIVNFGGNKELHLHMGQSPR
ncbi:DUF2158 domain-containing protein [Pseudaminobacter soli (ex Li et al. 2025)]|uniref:DUF2158 domain-containing protein n=1 Tax=Pseudaminobacter soli (ex Li et al. 2025) TaxID=1295366 RepID=UPI003D15F237